MANTQAGGERRVHWFAAGLGLALAVAAQLGGTVIFFQGHRGTLLGQGLLTFGALLAGGFLAGFAGPPAGAVWNGMIAAIGFIVVAQLAGAAAPLGPLGSGALDTLGLIVDDLLVLSGGTLGGVLAGSARRLQTR